MKVDGNGIYDNSSHGVLVQGEATVTNNDIFSNQMCALMVEPVAECLVILSTLSSSTYIRQCSICTRVTQLCHYV